MRFRTTLMASSGAGIWLCLTALCNLADAQMTSSAQAPQNPPAHGGEIPRQQENKTAQSAMTNERWRCRA